MLLLESTAGQLGRVGAVVALRVLDSKAPVLRLDCGDQRWVENASDFSKEYKANSNYFSYKWREEEVNRAHSQEWMLQRINKVITEEDSGHPLKALPEQEIHKAVFYCQPEWIPGPDGFQRNLLKSGTSSKNRTHPRGKSKEEGLDLSILLS